MQSPLWKSIRESGISTLSVVGMTKNTGKTVCLNHLLEQARQNDVAVGITSIGRDGEARDEVFGIPKPPVQVKAGTLVATARDTLVRAGARCKFIAGTKISSPMGEIQIVKTLSDGEMEIAGASRSSDQHRVIELLKKCGADLTLLDGALGRSHHASPALAEAVVVCTGAAVGPGMQDVIRKTRDRLEVLSVQQAEEETASRVSKLFQEGGVGAWDMENQLVFREQIASLNASGALLQLINLGVGTVAVTGAVASSLWKAVVALQKKTPTLTLVIADATRLFIEADQLRNFQSKGGRVRSMRGIRIAGITVNPFSPFGSGFDAKDFLLTAKKSFPGYVVTDVLLESENTKHNVEGIRQ